MTQYYKFLTDDMNGGYYSYPYEVGVWTEPVAEPEYCRYGYHVIERHQVLPWILPNLWEVETLGKSVPGDEKTVFESIRLVRKLEGWNVDTQRQFALDCAIKVLPIFERARPGNNRVRECIEVARKYLAGKATKEELYTAASAARAAAYAARAAADAAYAARAAADAARAAADAAYAAYAARAAADAAADAADAREEFNAWAIERFWKYVDSTARPLRMPKKAEEGEG